MRAHDRERRAREAIKVPGNKGGWLGAIKSDEAGYVMIMTIFTVIILLFVGLAMIVSAVSEVTMSKRTTVMDQSYSLAENGIDRGIAAVANNEGSLQTLTNAGQQWTSTEPITAEAGGTASYTVTVYQDTNFPGQAGHKTVVSKGI